MIPQRVAIHTDGFTVQGNERQIAAVARGLVQRGHEVHISARPRSPAWELYASTGACMSGVRVRGNADIMSVFRFALWLRRIAPDAILFTSWRRLWPAAVAARIAGVPNRVMRFGGRHEVPHGWRGAHYRHALLRLVDRVYANSALLRDHLTASGVDPGRVHLVPNGVDPPHASGVQSGVDSIHAPAASLRDRLTIPADAMVVVAVGGLSRRKGFDLLIRACAELDVHVVICGEGSERPRLERLARDLDFAARFHLLGHCRDVPSVLAAADVFVLSSRAEGFSVALLEAMSAGLPIVSTAVGGAAEALQNESGSDSAGWTVPGEDPDALRAAIDYVLRNRAEPVVVERIREARRRAEEEFTTESMVEGVERVLLDAGGRARRQETGGSG